jgi:hypothetical protein
MGITVVSSITVIGLVVAQLLGKSLIKKLWSFFLGLQVALVTYENNK